MSKRSNETITLGSGKLFCQEYNLTETYALSTDTTVNRSKVYYTRAGSEGSYTYSVVSNPTGNPSTSSYYEKTIVLPENSTLEAEANRLAWIKGGASLEYAGEFYDAKDDLGMVSKRKITSEEVKLTSGIMTWNGNVLKKLCSTARVVEANGKRTVKIGGTTNDDGKVYIIRFLHEDAVDGDVRVTLVGQNTSGFTLQFATDAETVIDAEFSAVSGKLDKEGTLVIIEEDIDAQG